MLRSYKRCAGYWTSLQQGTLPSCNSFSLTELCMRQERTELVALEVRRQKEIE